MCAIRRTLVRLTALHTPAEWNELPVLSRTRNIRPSPSSFSPRCNGGRCKRDSGGGPRIVVMELASTVLDLAGSGDAVRIAHLSRDEIERGLPWRWRPAAIRRLIAAPEVAVLCARCRVASSPRTAELLGGFGVMEFGLDRAHLVLLAVAPRLRRRGLARRMLRWFEKSARTAGIGEIDLEVRADNTGARRFYLVEGFSRGEYLPGYYQGRVAAYRMNKKLGHA